MKISRLRPDVEVRTGRLARLVGAHLRCARGIRLLSRLSSVALSVALTAALLAWAGCDDFRARRDLDGEREDSAYRAALADYRAGRLDAAARGFAKAIRKNPANASARFQYACLMQDTAKDYLEAFCAYREYLLQQPESDKAKIAHDRLALCERELAKELAEKHRLLGDDASAKEIASLKKDLKTAEDRAASAEKLLSAEREKFRALSSEHDRLVAAVKGEGAEEPTAAPRRAAVTARDLLDEEDDEPAARPASSELATLKAEEAEETRGGTGPSLLPQQTADDRARRDAAEKSKSDAERAAAAKAAAERAGRPTSYVVQEGDTLYKIALRFYGHRSAWRRIRDANKATISNDGRVKAGQSIRLP